MNGFDQLDAMIAKVRAIPGIAAKAAPDCAQAVRRELERTIAAGTTPDGQPWQPTAEGAQPLRNAANALRVAASGTTIYVRLTGPEARHHLGRARGGITRAIIPTDSKLPAAMCEAINAELTKHFNAAVANG
jgi:hypothetical protein